MHYTYYTRSHLVVWVHFLEFCNYWEQNNFKDMLWLFWLIISYIFHLYCETKSMKEGPFTLPKLR